MGFLCHFQVNDETLIKSIMKDYDRYVVDKNTQAISNLYTEDAMYGDNVKGKKAIKEYLDSYRNVDVVAYQSSVTNINVKNNIANYEGNFKQVVRANNKLVEYKGTFRMIWQKQNKNWYISSMRVTSKKSK